MTCKLIALCKIFMVFPTLHKILLLPLLMLLLLLLLLLMMMMTIIITINSCQKNKNDADEETVERRINCLLTRLYSNIARKSTPIYLG